MLQQTQVSRVIPKFGAFIATFPNERALSQASLADVLSAWQGLGYNRRAKFLHEAARRITTEFGGVFPSDHNDILSLPGVGPNTAGAIEAYAFNQPALYIETNIRTVYMHHFYADAEGIDDKQIIEKLSQTIDRKHPREFYWALMDYGSWLKSSGVKNISKSRHYKRQSPLEGSIRQVRGQIIRQLTRGDMDELTLRQVVVADERFEPALASLQKDGLIAVGNGRIHLTK